MEALAARVALIQAEAEWLAQYLATLPPDAWRQPSACPGWEVRDVVAHLVQVAQFYVRTITRGVQGDMARPPELAPPAIAPGSVHCTERHRVSGAAGGGTPAHLSHPVRRTLRLAGPAQRWGWGETLLLCE